MLSRVRLSKTVFIPAILMVCALVFCWLRGLKAETTLESHTAQTSSSGEITKKEDSRTIKEIVGKLDRYAPAERKFIPLFAYEDVNALVSQLEEKFQSDDNDVCCYAAFLMGQYRLAGSASVLNSRITLKDQTVQRNSNNSLYWWYKYPAADAMIEIGLPSVEWVVHNLAEESDKLTRKLSITVLFGIYQDKQLALYVLQKALKQKEYKHQQANLQLAIKSMQAEDYNRW